jgi:two-component system, cell cycle sensor histidine kinase and response regulator CckA
VFALITPLSYWILVALWASILWLYLRTRRQTASNSAVAVLLLILSIDALRTLIESAYFGLYFNSQFGLLPAEIQAFLGRPELIVLPKLVNIAAGLTVLILLIRRWLPSEIRERSRQEELLRNSEDYNRRLFNTLPVGLVLCRMSGELVDLNPAFAAIIGYSTEEARRLTYWDITPNKYVEEEQRQFDLLEQFGHCGSIEKEYRHKDGHLVPVSLVGVKIYKDGTPFIWSSVKDISDRKRAEEERRKSELKFQSLLQSAPLPLLLSDAAGRVSYINDRFTRLFGYNLEDVSSLDAWRQLAYPDPDYRQMVVKTWTNKVQSASKPGSDLTPLEIRVCCKNGQIRMVEISGIVLEDGRLVTFVDRTEHIRAEQALRDSEQRYRKLYEEMAQPMALHEIICDAAGKPIDYRFLDVNPAFERLLDMPRETIIGSRALELLPDTESTWIEHYGRVALTGQSEQFDNFAASLNRHFSVLAYSPDKGQFAVIVTDVTERIQMLESQQRLQQQILQAQKMESLGVLAGGIAHDFNNILMTVLGNVDLALLRLTPESPATIHLKQIESAAAKAADLSNQMLAYSGKGKFVVEPLNLDRIIEEMAHMLEISISKQAVLRFNFSDNLPSVEADATQLRQVILNLVINASEAIGKRSGVISISTGAMNCDRAYLEEVWIDSGLSEGLYVYVEIADTGCGIARENIDRIFDPFFTTKFAGRGLGIAAVLGIIRGHRGAIKVYSELGRGTTFKILLPASDRPAMLFDNDEAPLNWKGDGAVLLVDDEETVRSIGTSLLEELGFRVITCTDGREALKVFQQRQDQIRFVLMDLTMPHMDGEEAFREMRRINPEVKVIMTSGYNEQDVSQKFVGKKLAGFLQKPYTLSALGRAARKILEPQEIDTPREESAPDSNR